MKIFMGALIPLMVTTAYATEFNCKGSLSYKSSGPNGTLTVHSNDFAVSGSATEKGVLSTLNYREDVGGDGSFVFEDTFRYVRRSEITNPEAVRALKGWNLFEVTLSSRNSKLDEASKYMRMPVLTRKLVLPANVERLGARSKFKAAVVFGAGGVEMDCTITNP